jgi:hypothetical protein
MVVDVVVCVPFTQTHFTVSPRLMVKDDGVNEKFWTVTVWVVAFAMAAKRISVKTRRILFKEEREWNDFMMIVFVV